MKKQPRIKEPLFQAFVETKDGEVMAFTPKASKEFVDRVADAMKLAINLGKQPGVGNVHIKQVLAN